MISVSTCNVLHCSVSLHPVHLMHGFALVIIIIIMWNNLSRKLGSSSKTPPTRTSVSFRSFARDVVIYKILFRHGPGTAWAPVHACLHCLLILWICESIINAVDPWILWIYGFFLCFFEHFVNSQNFAKLMIFVNWGMCDVLRILWICEVCASVTFVNFVHWWNLWFCEFCVSVNQLILWLL